MGFATALQIEKGITAIIGSGGKTSLLCRLASELSGRVLICTTTHMFPPAEFPFAQRAEAWEGVLCVGTPTEMGKLTAPQQSFAELSALADYILVEADGSKHLPLKAHAPHEPVIPPNCRQVITVVGASGLNRPAEEAVHRPERFFALTGSAVATPEAVALALQAEALGDKILIHQADTHRAEALALAECLPKPLWIASVRKGEIECLY